MTETWKLTLPCTRAEAERLAGDVADLADLAPAPALVTTEPDSAQPEVWQLDAYFEGKPSRDVLRRVAALVPSARAKEPRARPLADEDWVTVSQAGFAPLTVGRFHVRTPGQPLRPDAVDIVIPAGLAFGTGQHATTAGSLAVLDGLKQRGAVFRNLFDVGSGTGLLAFAALKLWPQARATASDIDPVAVAVMCDNAALNGVRIGSAPGSLLPVVADGLGDRRLVARAPYDLVIANILAQPLIDMAPQIAASVAQQGTLLLAGLLDQQAASVARAYRRQGLALQASSGGEWPVLRLRSR